MLHEMRHDFQCRVFGKLLLCGEHIALCGGGACGVPVEESLVLDFAESEKGFACVSYVWGCDGTRVEVPIPPVFFTFVRQICEVRGLPLLGHTLCGAMRLESSIPIGSGLGSSAAFCCAIARLVLHYSALRKNEGKIQEDEYNARVWHLAHVFEQFFHIKASGIDTALCTFGKPLVLLHVQGVNSTSLGLQMQFETVPLPRYVVADLHAVYGFVPRQARCAQTIKTVQQNLRVAQWRRLALIKETEEVLKVLCGAANCQLYGGKLCATQGLCDEVSPYMTRIHKHLRDLGASTSFMEQLLLCAREHGASAAKLSGGGGGGAFVCMCPSHETAERVVNALGAWLSTVLADGAYVVRGLCGFAGYKSSKSEDV